MIRSMAEPIFHPARVAETWDETPLLRGVRFELESSGSARVLETYRQPGQYIRISVAGVGEGIFALAGTPGESFELLVKRGAALADALSNLPAGAEVGLTEAQGAGFPMGEARGHDVLLFAMGSGIAPIRATMLAIAREREAYGAVTLFEGQRHGEHFAFPSDRAAWVAKSISLIEVASQPTESWAGRKGYVQAAVLEVKPRIDNAVAFLCGKKPMIEAVREVLAGMGMPKGRTYLNY
jgi:NAD(P)H-flavin reductase